jgi:hypothetical protein
MKGLAYYDPKAKRAAQWQLFDDAMNSKFG